ncbi:MAG TPA: TetR/AcrR family transcriptional regulator [Acidimicrobiales bacterium]|nr:TetR/AcrR family transcriptional regulator [Acidimicrobiales bacterium]
MSTDGARLNEILQTAATLFASAGLRASLKEIADACGILPGSLYHHFESKEAIVLELVRRYREDLDRLAAVAIDDLHTDSKRPVEDRVIAFGREIAACGVRHRAALLLTLYDPPAVLGDELAQLASQTPVAIEAAMLELLREGRAAGAIRAGIDLGLLSDRLCQSMLHVGVGVSHMTPGSEKVPEIRLRILLQGIASRTPSNAALDRSSSFQAVDKVVAEWGDDDGGEDGRNVHLRAVARREFGRRGFESTTMRDIAGAAEVSTGTLYRSFRSKDDLLASIMRSYTEKVKSAWDAALNADCSALEKLDALMWANIHVTERFSDEFRIQLAWLRQSPPSTPDLGLSFGWHLRHVKAVMTEGEKSGEFHIEGATADVRARCLQEAIVFPPNIVRAAGHRAAQGLARETVLRGAVTRPRGGT